MQKNGNCLEVELAQAPETIITDQFSLQKVLISLLNNVAKFTRDGLVKLEVVREHGEILYRVRDNGFGIPAGQI